MSVARRNSNPFVTPSTVRSMARRGSGMLVDAVAGSVPYGPQAVAAARMIQRMVRGYQGRRRASAVRNPYNFRQQTGMGSKGPSKKWLSASTGYSGGKFNTPKKSKSPKIETLCLKKGYHVTLEVTGRVEDPHCAYVGHSTYNTAAYANVIAGALIRKAFKKAGVSMDQGDQEIIGTSEINAAGWVLQYVVYNPANGQTTTFSQYTTVDNDTLDGLINEISKFALFKNHLKDFMNNAIDFEANRQEPYALNLYLFDANDILSTKRPAATLNLPNEYVELFAASKIKIQNRTAADLATTSAEKLSSDRIDNQPLKGYVYEFNGEPRLKFPRTIAAGGVNQINYLTQEGVTLWRAADLPAAYIEPPVAKLWANCPKSASITIDPGQLKTGYVSIKYKGRLVNLLKKLRVDRITADRFTGAKGRMQVYALEEKIRTPGTNPITLQYEAELKVGAITKSGPTAPLQSSYTHSEKNALPA